MNHILQLFLSPPQWLGIEVGSRLSCQGKSKRLTRRVPEKKPKRSRDGPTTFTDLMAQGIKRVLVCGKTGSGKSTIANMLLTGCVTDPFRTDDAATCVTVNCETKSNGDYSITDTVGFGEVADAEKAGESLLKYMENVGTVAYSHVLFVARAGRIDKMDRLVWETFLKIFKGTERAFLVVFTNASDADWVARNRKALEETYKECPSDRFIAVDFPSKGVSENYCQRRREESRSRLTAALDGILKQNNHQYHAPDYTVDSDEEMDGNQSDRPLRTGSQPPESDKGKSFKQSDRPRRAGSQTTESYSGKRFTLSQALQESRQKETAKEQSTRSVHRAGSCKESGRENGERCSDSRWKERWYEETDKENGGQATNRLHRAGCSNESGSEDGEQYSRWKAWLCEDEVRPQISEKQYRSRSSSSWEVQRVERRGWYSEKQAAKMKAIVKDVAKSAAWFGFTSLLNYIFGIAM